MTVSKKRRSPTRKAALFRRGWGGGRVQALAWALLRLPVLCTVVDMLTSARYVVKGDSMVPALRSGQYLLVSRTAYRRGAPTRGDIVVLRDPRLPARHSVKRVIALPGERVVLERGQVLVQGAPLWESYVTDAPGESRSLPEDWLLGPGEYVVLGDNRSQSSDSRTFGPVKRELILGKVWLCYWPRDSWGIIRPAHPSR